MFCRFCGNELPEDANFCTKCGKTLDESQVQETPTEAPAVLEDLIGDPATREQEDPFKREKDELSGSILTFGIMSLAFGVSGILGFLGIIFAAIAKSKVSKYLAKFQHTEGRATVGKHLSTAGLWVSIGYTIFFVIYFAIIFLAIIFGSAEPSGTYYVW
ncbi:MAG: zinc ribbon domain-containing protein [Clostridia bacterium]|nr:zinc ribbon domain-containing protein [Clostridia bacterium]